MIRRGSTECISSPVCICHAWERAYACCHMKFVLESRMSNEDPVAADLLEIVTWYRGWGSWYYEVSDDYYSFSFADESQLLFGAALFIARAFINTWHPVCLSYHVLTGNAGRKVKNIFTCICVSQVLVFRSTNKRKQSGRFTVDGCCSREKDIHS